MLFGCGFCFSMVSSAWALGAVSGLEEEEEECFFVGEEVLTERALRGDAGGDILLYSVVRLWRSGKLGGLEGSGGSLVVEDRRRMDVEIGWMLAECTAKCECFGRCYGFSRTGVMWDCGSYLAHSKKEFRDVDDSRVGKVTGRMHGPP